MNAHAPSLLNAEHVLFACHAVQDARNRLGIAAFKRDFVKNNDDFDVTMFCAFVSGYDANGVKISVRDHKMRGRAIMDLQKLWISLWDGE